jgi:hypothetical protein
MDVQEISLLASIATSAGLYLTMVGGFVAAMWRRDPTPALNATAGVDSEAARRHR